MKFCSITSCCHFFRFFYCTEWNTGVVEVMCSLPLDVSCTPKVHKAALIQHLKTLLADQSLQKMHWSQS